MANNPPPPYCALLLTDPSIQVSLHHQESFA
jgi:hypothetical protein